MEHGHSPFHHGEEVAQRRAGVDPKELLWARDFVRPFMPDQHRRFFSAQPFAVLATRDSRGLTWATVLASDKLTPVDHSGSSSSTGDDGRGLITSPDPHTLVFSRGLDVGDPAAEGVVPGADVGLLGIELSTRRRNRLSATVAAPDGGVDGFKLVVRQSFGNCPKHIRERSWHAAPPGAAPPSPPERMSELTDKLQQWIAQADTFFIATGYRDDSSGADHPSFGMDASHRGGEPGFVRAVDPRVVEFGDFNGNNLFNTLGNIELDPRCGVTFVDFEQGSILQLSCHAEIDWDATIAAERFPGAERIVRFHVDDVVVRRHTLPIRWDPQPAAREWTVVAVRPESEGVKSFYLVPTDGEAPPSFTPGQYLPVSLVPNGMHTLAERTYSLSAAAALPYYRITVKREAHGLVSRELHDNVVEGATMRASSPKGEFCAPDGDGPLVLVAAGVGITPFAPMLHALAGTSRRVVLVHGARDTSQQPLGAELRRVAKSASNIEIFTMFSRPREGDVDRVDGASEGRIDAASVVRASGELISEAHVMLCGPSAFMATLTKTLLECGVDQSRILQESFNS